MYRPPSLAPHRLEDPLVTVFSPRIFPYGITGNVTKRSKHMYLPINTPTGEDALTTVFTPHILPGSGTFEHQYLVDLSEHNASTFRLLDYLRNCGASFGDLFKGSYELQLGILNHFAATLVTGTTTVLFEPGIALDLPRGKGVYASPSTFGPALPEELDRWGDLSPHHLAITGARNCSLGVFDCLHPIVGIAQVCETANLSRHPVKVNARSTVRFYQTRNGLNVTRVLKRKSILKGVLWSC